jgi:predicted MPP superfamily phosphohydrolase
MGFVRSDAPREPIQGFSDDRFDVFLFHTPDLVEDVSHCGVDLYLCGHTHGGQLCLPGGIPIVTGSLLGRRFARGRVELGATTIYTARGLGFEGLGAPRARLFCRPEITLWEITE